jgi:cytochrome oxidase Cu insertion factor (SCO1/SenC/PrrC family)
LSAEPTVSPLRRFLLGGLGALLAAQTKPSTPTVPARFIPPREQAFDFKLRDQHGKMVSLATNRGKVVVLTFLYTSCRDLCPAQAAEIVDAVQRVGAKGVVVYGVSVDPVGDTPEHVHEWLEDHGLEEAPVEYLSGTKAELEPVWKAYGIAPVGMTPAESRAYWEQYEEAQESGKEWESGSYRHPVRPPSAAAEQEFPDAGDLTFRGRPRHAEGAEYEHSAYVLLIDPKGEQRVGFPFEQLNPALLAQDIQQLRDS